MTKTVLVVDDDPTQRRLIQAVLERDGFAVTHAEGGAQAIDGMIAGKAADVLLLDLNMPGMSGMETLAEMRARGLTPPVIVVTATGGIDTVVKAMQAGAVRFAGPAHEVVTEQRLRALYDIDFDIVRNERGCVCNYFTPTGA